MNNSQKSPVSEYRALLKAVSEYIEIKKHFDECIQDLEDLCSERKIWEIRLKQQEGKLISLISSDHLCETSKIVGGEFEIKNASDIEILPVPEEMKDLLRDLVMGNEEE